MRQILLSIPLLFVLLLAPAAVAVADPACGDTVTADTTLTADLVGCADGLTVQGPATLDLGGHVIRGMDTGTGVVLSEDASVRNGTVSRFLVGIAAGGGLVDQVTVTGNGTGVRGSGGLAPGSPTVRDSVIAGNTGPGALFFSDRPDVSGSRFERNGGAGLAAQFADRASYRSNRFTDNGSDGLNVYTGTSTISGNIATGNHGTGISVEDWPRTAFAYSIAGNRADDNGALGISFRGMPFDPVSGNDVDDGANTATGNGDRRQCVQITCPGAPAPAFAAAPTGVAFRVNAGDAGAGPTPVAVTNTGGGRLVFTTSSDQSWLTAVAFPPDGVEPGTFAVAPTSVSVRAETTGLPAGVYHGTVTLRQTDGDAVGTIPVTLTVAAPALPGLVAAYGFDEPSGSAATDSSGGGRTGTVRGAHRTTGRFGGALDFDGVDDWVTVPDSTPLHFTTGLTVEAWVNPDRLGSAWRTVAIKERPPGMLSYGLYANTAAGRPAALVRTRSESEADGPAGLARGAWTHVAATYDGAAVRLYVNGVKVAQRSAGGPALTSGSPLRIGGNSIWGEWFDGRIDELRVYNRALSPAELRYDRALPVSATSPPAG